MENTLYLKCDPKKIKSVGNDAEKPCLLLLSIIINLNLPHSFSTLSPVSPPESTQLEDPRAQWQREQECMLRDYLSVARDALSAQKEIYQVKEQRLRLAQQEFRQLNDAWRDKSTSQTSCEYRGGSADLMEPDLC